MNEVLLCLKDHFVLLVSGVVVVDFLHVFLWLFVQLLNRPQSVVVGFIEVSILELSISYFSEDFVVNLSLLYLGLIVVYTSVVLLR